VEVIDDDAGTETTRTPSRAGVTVNESVESRDIDMLLLRRVELLSATVAMALVLDDNNSDCIPPAAAAALAGDVDALLTAWTSSIVFCPDELLPTGRLDSTRPLLHTEITPRLLLGRCMLLDGNADVAAAETNTPVYTVNDEDNNYAEITKYIIHIYTVSNKKSRQRRL